MRQIPKFKSEEEELAFWDEHDVAEFDAGPAEEIVWDLAPSPSPAPRRGVLPNGFSSDPP